MANVTLSIDDKVLDAGRKFAQKQGISFNALIRQLLTKTVIRHDRDWLDSFFEAADKIKPSSKGRSWKRGDLYDV